MSKKLITFIAATLALVSAWASPALPASVRQLLDMRAMKSPSCNDPSRVPVRLINGEEMVDAFIAIDHAGVTATLAAAGVRDICPFEGFVTARIPLSQLTEVCQMPGVTDVEISPTVQLCTDTTLSVTHAGAVINGTASGLATGYDGTGVILAIIDVGFDYQHRAFMRADDPTVSRIVRVYDTQDKTGHPAKFNNSTLSGSVFMGDEIYQLTTDNANGTHGTHTASIAAGTHVNGYGGMAPGADIVLCAVSYLGSSMSVTEISSALRYIRAYADSVSKPCVISMSVSTTNGAHDGLDYFSNVMRQITGEGCVFVIAAGNNGGYNYYSYGATTTTHPANWLVKASSVSGADSTYYYYNCWMDTWLRTPKVKPTYRYHIVDVNTHEVVWQSDEYTSLKTLYSSEFSDYYEPDTSKDSVGYFRTYVSYSPYSKRYELKTYFHNLRSKSWTTDAQGVKHSNYALGFSVRPSTGTDTCWVDSWLNNSYASFGWLDGASVDNEWIDDYYLTYSDSCSIGTYAVCDSVISAGAFVGRNSYYSQGKQRTITDATTYPTIGDIAMFSSYEPEGYGPTGEALPTVSAPGVMVIAAGSRYSSLAASTSTELAMRTDDGNAWCVLTGTSMAAPTVAGIIAQWMQVNPTLAPANVKHIIAQTAIHDPFTDGEHSDRFGATGKIDALAGIKYLLGNADILLGDVNGDGEINVTDLTALIDYVLGSSPQPFVLANADINGDGIVNIADITELIDLLLSQA